MTWRVYYDDGSYSDNELTAPYRVICIVQPREKTGREVLHEYAYYMLKNGVWYPAEDTGSLVQQMIYFAPEIEAVAMGIWTSGDNYNAIIHAAMTDEGLPRRSANDPDRRR
jgi:hypothetical protein